MPSPARTANRAADAAKLAKASAYSPFERKARLKRRAFSLVRLRHSLLWTAILEKVALREWLSAVGQERADRRLAHLLCELRCYWVLAGQSEGKEYFLP